MIYVENTPLFELKSKNCRIDAVRLNTSTDFTDTLVEVKTSYLFNSYNQGWKLKSSEGNIFIIYDYDLNRAYEIVTFAADFEVPSIYMDNGGVYLNKGGFEVELLESDIPSAKSTVRKYLAGFTAKKLVAMSNTWGDGNTTSRVCADFVKKELDAAEELGLDGMQIDDGWQLGSTSDPARRNELGERVFDGDFWEENKNRFPNGLKEIGDYAENKTVVPGLWFAPDFHGHFHYAERDAELLKRKHDEMGCAFIKLDMLNILSKEDRESFIAFCEELKKFALLELDVTCWQRLGYILSLRQGLVFVENRYTKSDNYLPCRTLKNIWELGAYLPLQALQAELLNPDLNGEKYTTLFAPVNYSMDYLFASVCFANPLFWLETQNLSEKRKNELKRIFPEWKNIRDEVAKNDIVPIGEIPSGRSFTGFFANGRESYAVLFREYTEKNEYSFDLGRAFSSTAVLASNCEASVTADGESLKVKLSEPNGYALVKLD